LKYELYWLHCKVFVLDCFKTAKVILFYLFLYYAFYWLIICVAIRDIIRVTEVLKNVRILFSVFLDFASRKIFHLKRLCLANRRVQWIFKEYGKVPAVLRFKTWNCHQFRMRICRIMKKAYLVFSMLLSNCGSLIPDYDTSGISINFICEISA